VGKPPKGTVLEFRFFRDKNGRLRCHCPELGVTKPVETADRKKRYRFAKVFGINTVEWFGEETAWRLQLAKEGDVITAVVQ